MVQAGIESHILAPTKMAKAAKDRKKKADEKDARRIFEMFRAHVLVGNELPDIWIPDQQTRDDRETARARLGFGKKLTSIKNQVQTLLKRNGVVKPEEAGNSWIKRYRLCIGLLYFFPCSWISFMTLNLIKPIKGEVLDDVLYFQQVVSGAH